MQTEKKLLTRKRKYIEESTKDDSDEYTLNKKSKSCSDTYNDEHYLKRNIKYIGNEPIEEFKEKNILNLIMTDEDISALAEEIVRFRKWYVHDLNVFDRIRGEELSVRDARYNILAEGFLGEKYDYDFRTALDYTVEGYDVRII